MSKYIGRHVGALEQGKGGKPATSALSRQHFEEALFVSIVSFSNLSTEKEQKEFIKAIAGIACPQDDADDVSDWVKDTIGISGSVTINNVTYELEIGPNGNLCYSVGQPEWEAWESSFN